MFNALEGLTMGAKSSDSITPVLERLETGTPAHETQQLIAAKTVSRLPWLQKNRHRIDKIYANSRIDTRQLAIDLTKSENIHSLVHHPIQVRMQMFMEHACSLTEKVARKALTFDSNGKKSELMDLINLIVIVSSTGFVAPGLDVKLIKQLGLKHDTARVNVGFMGCAGAMNGLRIACNHARVYPNHKVLLVCIELSSINAVFEDDLNNVITHGIFGDGCAVAVIGGMKKNDADKQEQVTFQDHMSYLVPNTEDGIELGLQDNAITCTLSPSLPDYLTNYVGKSVEEFLKQHGRNKNDIDFWAVHPGGRRIIENVQCSLGLRDEQIEASWDILCQYGNMLSPAVLFVLKNIFSRMDKGEYKSVHGKDFLLGFAFSFSPGIGVEGVLLKKSLDK
jgi:alpha-pyrone synthase